MKNEEFEVMKMHNPIFRVRFSSCDKWPYITNDISTEDEMILLKEMLPEFANLMADPSVGAFDKFPHYIQFLLNKRYEQLNQNKGAV